MRKLKKNVYDNLMKYISHRGRMLEDAKNKQNKYKNNDNKVEYLIKMLKCKNCDGIEVDLQLSKDKKVIMYHDIYVEDEYIRDCSSEYLKKIHEIDLFEDLMNQLNDEILMENTIILDLKGVDEELIIHLMKILENRNTSNMYLCSFNRKLSGKIPFKMNKGTTFEVILREYEQADFILSHDAVMIHWTCLSQDIIDKCKKKKVKVCSYTHKTKIELDYIKSFEGVDFVISDVISCL